MTMIDIQTEAQAEADLALERRRSGRMDYDNPHLVTLLRHPDAIEPGGFDDALIGRPPASRSPNRLRETILVGLGFWALAFWLLKVCVG